MFFIGRHCTLSTPSGPENAEVNDDYVAAQQASAPAHQWQLGMVCGLLERVEHAERDLLFGPIIGSIAEDVKQGFPCFLVKFLGIRQLFEHDQETFLVAGSGHGGGQRFAQTVEILAYALGKLERFGDQAQYLLLGGTGERVRIQEVMAEARRFLLQFDHAESTDRLHQVGGHGHQQRLVSLDLTRYVRCVHFVVESA